MHCCVYWQRYENLCALICTFAMITCLNVHKIVTLLISLRTKAILPTWSDVLYTKKIRLEKISKQFTDFGMKETRKKSTYLLWICFKFNENDMRWLSVWFAKKTTTKSFYRRSWVYAREHVYCLTLDDNI